VEDRQAGTAEDPLAERHARRRPELPAPLNSARREIGRLQRRLWQRQRRLIAASITGSGPGFRDYEARYLRRTRGHLREASLAGLIHEISKADVLYVGDYHTLKQSQRSFVNLVQRGKPALIALEFVQGRHQDALDSYLAGRLSEARFLERIGTTLGAWENFRPIFEEARRRRVPVIGTDLRAGSLAERDAYAARRIARALRSTCFVLAGQLHVAPPHLPAAVGKLVSAPSLVVYQNCERIWWELQRLGRELEVEACVIRPGEWCLINTPPVVVQQSWLDSLQGEELLDAPEPRFQMLAGTIARFLGLELGGALEEVAVYTAGDLSFLSRLPGFTHREIRQIEQQILSRESYYIPRARIAYLAGLSLNHAAEEAAHFVRNVVSGASDEPRGLMDAFYARALEEAYAFCGSKIVNPRRRCAHQPEFRRLARSGDALTRQVARLVLAHLELERGRKRRVRPLHGSSELFNAVSHALGYMLGEKLYYALATGRLSKREVRELFLDPLEEEGEAFLTYMNIARRVAAVRIPPTG